MNEQLLTMNQTAQRLGISRVTFWRNLPRLRAKGLQLVQLGKRKMFRAASLDKIIIKAAENETPL